MTVHSSTLRRWTRSVIAAAAVAVAYAIHALTLQRIVTWQPGYPGVVAVSTFTPPSLMRQLHLVGAWLLAVALLVFIVASFRTMPRLLRISGTALVMLVVLYAWTFIWVTRVSRYLVR